MTNFPDFTNYGYEILSELGHNRAGGRVTYLAKETNTGISVVIKQFQFAQTSNNWSDYQAYEREIAVLKKINHPQIPRYIDSFPTSSGFCLLQEYKDAPSLVKQTNLLPQKVKQIGIAVLDILKYLHNQVPPIIHRDLKPENILVDKDLNVNLVDFGFARLGGGEVAVSSVVKGTLGFMPPEQMFNRQVTPASDLYSLGATLVCLFTGTPSTAVGNLMDETGKISFMKEVPHLSFELIEWLQKMVAPLPQERYSDAEAALNALINLPILRPKKVSTKVKLATGLGLLTVGILIAIPLSKHPFILNKINSSELAISKEVNPSAVKMYAQMGSALNGMEPELKSVPLNLKKVYFTVEIDGVTNSDSKGVCQLFDSEGILVGMGEVPSFVGKGTLQTFCSYEFSPQIAEPGQWQFNFAVDGEVMIKKNIPVISPL